MAFDIQFKLIYQGIRDVFRVRSLSNDHKGLIQFLAHSESPPLTESKRKPCQLSCVNIIMFFKVLANISLNSEVLSPSRLLPVNLVPKGCIIK